MSDHTDSPNHHRLSNDREAYDLPEELKTSFSETEADHLSEVWRLIGPEDPVEGPDAEETEAALESFWRRTAKPGTVEDSREAEGEKTRESSGRTRRREDNSGLTVFTAPRARLLAAAAVVAILMSVGIWWWSNPIVRTAPPGEQMSVQLASGVSAQLNSGSTLRYSRSIRSVRSVHLDGEGYFVVPDGVESFIVHTFNATVRVTSTAFNVRAWSGETSSSTTVALEEGTVMLDVKTPSSKTNPREPVRMQPGEVRRITGSGDRAAVDTVEATVSDATAWIDGDLVFRKESLGTVITEVERRYGVEIRLRDPGLKDRLVSVALRNPDDLESVLRDLSYAFGLEYRPTSDGFAMYESSAAEHEDGRPR